MTTNSSLGTISSNAARLSIGAVIAYQLLLILLIFLRPDLDPSWHTISEWVPGPHGWLMRLAFFCSSASYASLATAIESQLQTGWGRTGLAMLLVCSVGTIGVGVFTTDPMPLTAAKGLTTTGFLHVLCGGVAMILLPLAALIVNASLAFQNAAWVPARRMLLWSGGIPLLGLAGFVIHLIVVVMPMGNEAYGPGVPLGWPPRFLFMSYAAWLLLLATQAIRLRKQTERDIPSKV